MDVADLVAQLVTCLQGRPDAGLTALSLRILSSRLGSASHAGAHDMLAVTQKIQRHLSEIPSTYDRSRKLERFQKLQSDFLTHAMLHKKAALLTTLLKLSLDTDPTTPYVPMPVPNLRQPMEVPMPTEVPAHKPKPAGDQETFRAFTKHDQSCDVPESVLLKEVLYAFQGIDSKFVYFNPAIERFEVARHVGVPLPMRDLIRKLTEVGWLYARLSSFIERHNDVHTVGVVCQSFCHALKTELSDFYRLVALLTAQTDVDADTATNAPQLTLKRLFVWTQDPLDRLRTMTCLVDSVEGLRGGALATGIHMYMDNGDPFVRSLVQKILNQVAAPILSMIQKWTLEGALDDVYNEFFVACDLSVSDEQLWTHKYHIEYQMLPMFISKELAHTIFIIGKSINFIRTCCGDTEWVLETELEEDTLTFDHWMEFQAWIDRAARETNAYVIKILLDKYQLLDHCRALKQYLLLGQGDFIQYLMDLLGPELSKRATQLYRHNLMNVLETALNASNAKYESADILGRLDVKLHQAASGDEGWDVFALHYKLQAPLNTVIQETTMSEYLRMFSFLFRVKRVEHSLTNCWGRDMNLIHVISKHLPEARGVIHHCNLLRSEMIHFTTNLHNYMMFEVLETSWHTLLKNIKMASDLDELIESHNAYLYTIKKNAFLMDESKPMLLQLKLIFDTIIMFCKLQDSLYTSAMREVHTARQVAKDREGDWGMSVHDRVASSVFAPSSAFVAQLRTVASDYNAHFLKLLEVLRTHSIGSENLPFLTFRLDFNEFYARKTTTTP
ncbi:gamma-tubulin complex component [Achlya hypogyna]|uniref:Gamma-tubulin complex component n=1 Tax=Achlya hypogyna TaxID=1202772 RepID=A0A1V9YEE9_ACHHY|nr:gamma-tubulin complex component [Achlya hypogyna]